MLTYTYSDGYLKNHITEDRETRAIAEVADYGTFDDYWNEKLTIIRTYIITCIECQAKEDDVFQIKLKSYQDEFDTVLSLAKAATANADGITGSLFSIPLLRA